MAPSTRLRPRSFGGFLLGTLPLDENDEVASWAQSQPCAETVFNRISGEVVQSRSLWRSQAENCAIRLSYEP